MSLRKKVEHLGVPQMKTFKVVTCDKHSNGTLGGLCETLFQNNGKDLKEAIVGHYEEHEGFGSLSSIDAKNIIIKPTHMSDGCGIFKMKIGDITDKESGEVAQLKDIYGAPDLEKAPEGFKDRNLEQKGIMVQECMEGWDGNDHFQDPWEVKLLYVWGELMGASVSIWVPVSFGVEGGSSPGGNQLDIVFYPIDDFTWRPWIRYYAGFPKGSGEEF